MNGFARESSNAYGNQQSHKPLKLFHNTNIRGTAPPPGTAQTRPPPLPPAPVARSPLSCSRGAPIRKKYAHKNNRKYTAPCLLTRREGVIYHKNLLLQKLSLKRRVAPSRAQGSTLPPLRRRSYRGLRLPRTLQCGVYKVDTCRGKLHICLLQTDAGFTMLPYTLTDTHP